MSHRRFSSTYWLNLQFRAAPIPSAHCSTAHIDLPEGHETSRTPKCARSPWEFGDDFEDVTSDVGKSDSWNDSSALGPLRRQTLISFD